MGPLVVPVVIICLGGGAFWASTNEKNGRKGEFTPERSIVFETALNEVKDAAKLKALADAFRKEGLLPQADLLEKRAKLRSLPEAIKNERRAVFRKGMDSKDPYAVRQLAGAFEKEGATGAANALRKYADTLLAAKEAPHINPPIATPTGVVAGK